MPFITDESALFLFSAAFLKRMSQMEQAIEETLTPLLQKTIYNTRHIAPTAGSIE